MTVRGGDKVARAAQFGGARRVTEARAYSTCCIKSADNCLYCIVPLRCLPDGARR